MHNIYDCTEPFIEYEPFNKYPFWNSFIMRFNSDVVTTPHYSTTIEVCLYNNVRGTVYIESNQYELSGKQACVIMPGVVHSMLYKKNNGYSTVLKINCDNLKSIFNIEAFLNQNNLRYNDIPHIIMDFDEIHSIAETFFTCENFNDIFIALVKLLNLIVCEAKKTNNSLPKIIQSENIMNVINYTEKNFANKITIEEIAGICGYSKYYFCKKFKDLTGMTYISYLNHLRIYHACDLLKNNVPLSSICDQCGFDDISYFIQLFKKITGKTPKKYIQSFFNNQ